MILECDMLSFNIDSIGSYDELKSEAEDYVKMESVHE